MSFGFGVGDFLAVLKLANGLRKDFVAAPTQLRSIHTEFVPSYHSRALNLSRRATLTGTQVEGPD